VRPVEQASRLLDEAQAPASDLRETMQSLILLYAEDPATGLPRLEDPSGQLSANQLDELARAVERQFERLAAALRVELQLA